VSPLDRAFLFGDAVYEVLPVYASRAFRLREHLDRLGRSLPASACPPAVARRLGEDLRELISRNSAVEAYLYLQVTRAQSSPAITSGLKADAHRLRLRTALDPLPAPSWNRVCRRDGAGYPLGAARHQSPPPCSPTSF